MKTTINILCAIALMVLVSATTVSVMTVKPENPKSIFVKEYPFYEDMKADIFEMSKNGWIVKSSYGIGQGRHVAYWYLVMEKY